MVTVTWMICPLATGTEVMVAELSEPNKLVVVLATHEAGLEVSMVVGVPKTSEVLPQEL